MGKTAIKSRPKKEGRDSRMAVILRGVRGFDWGFFSREDPRMHLQTVDSKNLDLYKVWLERKGKRVFEPREQIPAKVLKELETEVRRKRSHIEGRWVNLMIASGWLACEVKGPLITLTVYAAFPGSKFARVVNLTEYLAGIYDPSASIRPKEPVKPDDVVLNRDMAAIEIWPEKDESLRYHIFLPPILWQD